MTVRQRIFHALAANTFGQGITVFTQVLLTPLYFHHWGATLYGEWLLISSIPAYLAMADMGVGTAAGNEMTMQAGSGQWAKAQATYKGAMRVAAFAALATLLAGLALSGLALLGSWPQAAHMGTATTAGVMLCLTFHVMLGFFGTVVSAGYRAVNANATGIMWGNAGRLLEACITATLLVSKEGPLVLCACLLGARAAMLALQARALQQLAPQLFQPQAPTDKQLAKRLLRPSLAFMAMPLGNALALQGPLLILGSLSTPDIVATFAAMRTLARVPIQLANSLNASIWPEISKAWGEQNMARIRALHRKAWGLTFAFAMAALAGQCLLGEWVTRLWLGPEHHDPLVLNALAVAAALSATWNVSSVALVAVNAHARFSMVYIGVNALALGLSVASYHFWGMAGLLGCQLLPELLMLAWIWPAVIELTQDSTRAFFQAHWPASRE
jgi:O-antigen/teichoic acid export membrane protein